MSATGHFERFDRPCPPVHVRFGPKATEPARRQRTGRYILQPEIIELLEKQERSAGGEIQFTDAMIALAKKQPFFGLKCFRRMTRGSVGGSALARCRLVPRQGPSGRDDARCRSLRHATFMPRTNSSAEF
jgi:hypothetical protein